MNAVGVAVVAGVGWGGLGWPAAVSAATQSERAPIIVQVSSASLVEASVAAVRRLGGREIERLPLIDGFAASVPSGALHKVAGLAGVRAVAANAPVTLLDAGSAGEPQPGESADVQPADPAPPADPPPAWVSMASAIDDIGASAYQAQDITGRGVDVALIDSGVSRVAGIAAGRVVDGPDFTAEALDSDLAHRDGFGHGTHMAGIIAGTDGRAVDGFSGVAPDARLVNLKVADAYGRTDVALVIAAIGWAVHHRDTDGFHIRVLNLSFGTEGGAAPDLDPLDQAVEQAWRAGITVVVAAGNRGRDAGHLSNPARDPLVLAVGATDSLGRAAPSDDIALDFSSRGDGSRNPDLVAPGRSIVSLRAPGSYIDTNHESARVTDRLFRGSGTSQSAAMISGAVALVYQQHPDATPDQVKSLLNATAAPLANGGDETAQGHGLVDLAAAVHTPLAAAPLVRADPGPDGHPLTVSSDGSHASALAGTVELSLDLIHARAAATVHTNELSGDWDGSSWSGSSWSDGSWSGSSWSGSSWSADRW